MLPDTHTRAPLVPRKLLGEQVAFAGLLWLGLMAVTGAVIAGIAYWSEVDTSVWDDISMQIPRWWALFLCVWVANTMMPLYIAHGMTRREVAIQGAAFVLLYAAALALMVVLGFVLETLVYRAAGWSQEVDNYTLYRSATDYAGIFLGNWLGLAVWSATGIFAGAVFYRHENDAGILALALTAVPVTITEVVLDSSWGRAGQFVFERFGWSDTPAPVAIIACLASLALAMAIAWPVLRDLPLRPRRA